MFKLVKQGDKIGVSSTAIPPLLRASTWSCVSHEVGTKVHLRKTSRLETTRGVQVDKTRRQKSCKRGLTCMREMRGEMTRAIPSRKSAGNWKQRDLPKPVAITTTWAMITIIHHYVQFVSNNLIPLLLHNTLDDPPLQGLQLFKAEGLPQKVGLVQRWRSEVQSQELSCVVLGRLLQLCACVGVRI